VGLKAQHHLGGVLLGVAVVEESQVLSGAPITGKLVMIDRCGLQLVGAAAAKAHVLGIEEARLSGVDLNLGTAL
jgi:hypothetical protein